MNWKADLWKGTLDLVFAPVCVGCDSPIAARETERLVCRDCWARVRPIPAPRCVRCWSPLPPGRPAEPRCAACRAYPPGVRVARSACVLEGPVRRIIHALKYGGWRAVAEPIAGRMAEIPLPADVSTEAGVLVPVPASPVRMRERGYNQAALLAEALARKTDRRSIADALVRTHSRGTQTVLHPDERRANVAGAFRPGRLDGLLGEHVLLVDDVWTTGATALACAGTLLAAGVRAVSVLTFARALPGLDRPSP